MSLNERVLPDGGKPRTCWRCGADFVCGPRGGAAHCWCSALPSIQPVAEGLTCLCADCLAVEVALQERNAVKPAPPRLVVATDAVAVPTPVEGADYYIEGSAVVFTADYHRRRGTCCGNGCRHCPYEGSVGE